MYVTKLELLVHVMLCFCGFRLMVASQDSAWHLWQGRLLSIHWRYVCVSRTYLYTYPNNKNTPRGVVNLSLLIFKIRHTRVRLPHAPCFSEYGLYDATISEHKHKFKHKHKQNNWMLCLLTLYAFVYMQYISGCDRIAHCKVICFWGMSSEVMKIVCLWWCICRTKFALYDNTLLWS